MSTLQIVLLAIAIAYFVVKGTLHVVIYLSREVEGQRRSFLPLGRRNLDKLSGLYEQMNQDAVVLLSVFASQAGQALPRLLTG